MSESLSKSVQMAIEISTKSIERAAEHEAKRTEQMAKGLIERQKLTNEKEAESARVNLFELKAVTAAVESSGQRKAEAQAEAANIELNAELLSQEMVGGSLIFRARVAKKTMMDQTYLSLLNIAPSPQI
ncbi:Major vault protein [Acropora cervicornis]|uniref:Major vault protein n=1 Tax=Acropora cervicornis TaxID=6130 RepID=A0AAD9PUT7_ACRCE|nr:Major vault protein [Acropora cervicornis]